MGKDTTPKICLTTMNFKNSGWQKMQITAYSNQKNSDPTILLNLTNIINQSGNDNSNNNNNYNSIEGNASYQIKFTDNGFPLPWTPIKLKIELFQPNPGINTSNFTDISLELADNLDRLKNVDTLDQQVRILNESNRNHDDNHDFLLSGNCPK